MYVSRILVNYCKLLEAGGAHSCTHVVCHCFWFVLNQLHTLIAHPLAHPQLHTLNNNSQATMGNNKNSGVVLTVYTIAVIKNV